MATIEDETPLLTPLLQRALRILERSRFELIAEILAEVEKNPALQTQGEHEDDPAVLAEVVEPPAGVRPDAYVVEREGIFEVIPSIDRVPKLEIIKDHPNQKQALWFTRSLEQRNRSIEMVVRALINAHPEVFAGNEAPTPQLTAKDLSRAVGFHQSTIERVVMNKYIATAHGVWPLTAFVR